MCIRDSTKGNNGLIKRKYITFGIEADSLRMAKAKLDHAQSLESRLGFNASKTQNWHWHLLEQKLYTPKAVSYTHLDVYKRQIQNHTPNLSNVKFFQPTSQLIFDRKSCQKPYVCLLYTSRCV